MNEEKKRLWYSLPSRALTYEGWDEWRNYVKTNYPIQYFIRDTLPGLFRRYIYFNFREAYWFIYRIIRPCHKDIHRAIPRRWADIASLVVDVNFAMIKSFKKEADESFVDWDGTTKHREFKNWLDSAFEWVTVKRPELVKRMHDAYPAEPLAAMLINVNHDELYAEVIRLETIIDDTDSAVLKQMIDYRAYMWT